MPTLGEILPKLWSSINSFSIMKKINFCGRLLKIIMYELNWGIGGLMAKFCSFQEEFSVGVLGKGRW